MAQFFGKYRGTVMNNIDPMMLGRLQVTVPSVSDAPMSWAMPCVPFAGPDQGFVAIPAIGANVWVEFESGDPDSPVWTGCFWGSGELPAEAQVGAPDQLLVLKRPGFLLAADAATPNGLRLEVSPPFASDQLKLDMNNDGIVLTVNGSVTIKLTSSDMQLTNGASTVDVSAASVDINNGALTVT
ncbi:MAG: phage baseplate assembly protein V [Bryobacteraceae bacterium]